MGLRVFGVVFKLETRLGFLYLIKATRACDNQTRISKPTRPSRTFNSVHTAKLKQLQTPQKQTYYVSFYLQHISSYIMRSGDTETTHKHHLKPKKKHFSSD